MEEQPATLQRVTVAEAAIILSVSTATVRRMVKRGQLEGERVHRPQGTAFMIRLPGDASPGDHDASDMRQGTRVMPRDNASPGSQLAVWSETFLLPLVAALERSQTTVQHQAETIGRLTAENDALKASQANEAGQPEPQSAPVSAEPPASGWRRFWPRIVAILAVLVAALALIQALVR